MLGARHVSAGAAQLVSFQRLLPALIADVDKLSAEQQAARLAVYNKLRLFCYLIGFILVSNSTAFLLLSISSTLRQTGLPIYVYFWYYSAHGFITVRLMLLRPPQSNQPQPTAVVSPLHAATSAGDGGSGIKEKDRGAGRRSSSGVEAPSQLPTPTAAMAASGSTAAVVEGGEAAVEAGLGGWTERSRHPPGVRAMASLRIDEGVEDSSRRATPVPVLPHAIEQSSSWR